MWHGVSKWFGVTDDEDMKCVLLNHKNFGCGLFSEKDLHVTGENEVSSCGGLTKKLEFQMSLITLEPKCLSGIEQKHVCGLIIAKTLAVTGSKIRCVIKDQQIKVKCQCR